MKFFALACDGQIHNLGNHDNEDLAIANFLSNNKKVVLWVFEESEALDMAKQIINWSKS